MACPEANKTRREETRRRGGEVWGGWKVKGSNGVGKVTES